MMRWLIVSLLIYLNSLIHNNFMLKIKKWKTNLHIENKIKFVENIGLIKIILIINAWARKMNKLKQ